MYITETNYYGYRLVLEQGDSVNGRYDRWYVYNAQGVNLCPNGLESMERAMKFADNIRTTLWQRIMHAIIAPPAMIFLGLVLWFATWNEIRQRRKYK